MKQYPDTLYTYIYLNAGISPDKKPTAGDLALLWLGTPPIYVPGLPYRSCIDVDDAGKLILEVCAELSFLERQVAIAEALAWRALQELGGDPSDDLLDATAHLIVSDCELFGDRRKSEPRQIAHRSGFVKKKLG